MATLSNWYNTNSTSTVYHWNIPMKSVYKIQWTSSNDKMIKPKNEVDDLFGELLEEI